jgi:protocatechuate 3,4-dioxygenase beta subunit
VREESVMPIDPIRRRLLAASALAAAGLVLDDAFGEPLAPTPQCHDGDAPTVRQTEGPYFKPSSPQRADLVEPNSNARLVELSGRVLTRSCGPVAQALVDLWHADERGEYDDRRFRYRGYLWLPFPV